MPFNFRADLRLPKRFLKILNTLRTNATTRHPCGTTKRHWERSGRNGNTAESGEKTNQMHDENGRSLLTTVSSQTNPTMVFNTSVPQINHLHLVDTSTSTFTVASVSGSTEVVRSREENNECVTFADVLASSSFAIEDDENNSEVIVAAYCYFVGRSRGVGAAAP